MEDDETFEKFYARFSNIFNTFHNLGCPIVEEMQV